MVRWATTKRKSAARCTAPVIRRCLYGYLNRTPTRSRGGSGGSTGSIMVGRTAAYRVIAEPDSGEDVQSGESGLRRYATPWSLTRTGFDGIQLGRSPVRRIYFEEKSTLVVCLNKKIPRNSVPSRLFSRVEDCCCWRLCSRGPEHRLEPHWE